MYMSGEDIERKLKLICDSLAMITIDENGKLREPISVFRMNPKDALLKMDAGYIELEVRNITSGEINGTRIRINIYYVPRSDGLPSDKSKVKRAIGTMIPFWDMGDGIDLIARCIESQYPGNAAKEQIQLLLMAAS